MTPGSGHLSAALRLHRLEERRRLLEPREAWGPLLDAGEVGERRGTHEARMIAPALLIRRSETGQAILEVAGALRPPCRRRLVLDRADRVEVFRHRCDRGHEVAGAQLGGDASRRLPLG